jgi:hypothetical protein
VSRAFANAARRRLFRDVRLDTVIRCIQLLGLLKANSALGVCIRKVYIQQGFVYRVKSIYREEVGWEDEDEDTRKGELEEAEKIYEEEGEEDVAGREQEEWEEREQDEVEDLGMVAIGTIDAWLTSVEGQELMSLLCRTDTLVVRDLDSLNLGPGRDPLAGFRSIKSG